MHVDCVMEAVKVFTVSASTMQQSSSKSQMLPSLLPLSTFFKIVLLSASQKF